MVHKKKFYYIITQNYEILARVNSLKIAKIVRDALLKELNYTVLGIIDSYFEYAED